jgi:glucose/arabinose dehydrogenase
MKHRVAAIFALSVLPVALLAQATQTGVRCDPNNGGLILPVGFCALVVADETGGARHLAVANNGDVYVALRTNDKPSGVVALRDTNGDGRADTKERFGETGGTGILLYNGYLYMAQDTAVVRFPMKEGQLLPTGPAETVVSGFARQQVHATKSLAFDNRGGLYVNVGNPSNACTEPDQTRTPGLNPCTHQDHAGGVWRFDANQTGQVFEENGSRFMRGLRQTNSLRWNPLVNALYLVQHGRGGLNRWTEYFNDERNAETPSEEFLRVEEGSDFGFPYCYFDRLQGRRVLAPEYGGDGKKAGDCAKYPAPVMAFPAHWAPNDLLFYTGSQFPRKYYGGALIAFHGSGSRAPLPQGGYKVVFQPMQDGQASGTYETLADGFAGRGLVMQREEATARPMGLAQGPDGSLFIADSVKGKIWRVIYRGGATPATR